MTIYMICCHGEPLLWTAAKNAPDAWAKFLEYKLSPRDVWEKKKGCKAQAFQVVKQ